MMIASVLDYLKSDDGLTTMLNHKRSHPKITPYKAHSKNDYPYIIVTLTPFGAGKGKGIVTMQYKCEIRIVTDDDLMVETITRKVMDLLHFGNRPGVKFNKENETLYHSKYAGSGFLFDEEKSVFEQVLFFAMNFKR